MSEVEEVRQSLRRLARRLAEGEIDETTYDRLRGKLFTELTPAERAEFGQTTTPTTPRPAGTPSPISSLPLVPSGGKGGGIATRLSSLSDLDVRPGSLLFDKWCVERELGRGGFGVVVEAREIRLGMRQAVKILDPAMVVRPDLLERFRREVNATRDLVHPRIVQVYDYDENLSANLALFSMELVQGCSVQSLLAAARERGEAVPVRLAVTILAQVLEALEVAHAQGVIHRDVTPANVLLAGGTANDLLVDASLDPQVKLVDFGIAGALERSELSQKSRVLGTAAYVAPEVLDPSADITAAADVYGAGAVFYELLTGGAPLGRFADPSSIRPGLDKEVEALALSLLQLQPSSRPTERSARATALGVLQGGRRQWEDGRKQVEETGAVRTQPERPGPDLAGGPGRTSTAVKEDQGSRPVLIGLLVALGLVGAIVGWLLTRPTGSQPSTSVDSVPKENGQPGKAPSELLSVFDLEGNLFLKGLDGETVQLTRTEMDEYPALSNDRKSLVFVRGSGSEETENELWLMELGTRLPRRLATDYGISRPVFAVDDTVVFYYLISSAPNSQLKALDTSSLESRTVYPVSQFEVILQGPNRGHLLVSLNELIPEKGRYLTWRIIDSRGKLIRELGDDEKVARQVAQGTIQ